LAFWSGKQQRNGAAETFGLRRFGGSRDNFFHGERWRFAPKQICKPPDSGLEFDGHTMPLA
jgi:hypothetical protein